MLKGVSPALLVRPLAAWWGFAEADRLVLGLVVAVLAALAVTYVVVRVVRSRPPRHTGPAGSGAGAGATRRRG